MIRSGSGATPRWRQARRFGFAFFISLVVTVLIGLGAFRLSFESIRVLVIMLGTPPDLAGYWPSMIDLSIVGCTVALYALTRSRNSGEPSPTLESHNPPQPVRVARSRTWLTSARWR